MNTTARILRPTRRVKSLVVLGLLALALMTGVAGTTVSAAKNETEQPPVECRHYSRSQTIARFGFDPGAGGYWDCEFIDLDAPRLMLAA